MNVILHHFRQIVLNLQKAQNYRQEQVLRDSSSHILAKKKIISFANNDYLGLSKNRKLKKSGIKAIKKYGVGGLSSKFISGYNILYEKIKEQMLKIKNAEDCLIFSSGYLCNLGIFSALSGKGDIIFLDEYSHASSFEGAKLSGAKIIRFQHNEIEDLKLKLEKFGKVEGRIFIATETLFSMKGTVLLNPEEYVFLAEKYNAILVTDEAHSFGVLNFNFPKYSLHLQMGTFSKAVGCLGGYVCGSSILIDVIRNLAKSGIYTTALPPSILASILEALKLIKKKKITAKKALLNANFFGTLVGMEVKSQIVFLECNSSQQALEFAEVLQNEGFFVKAIRKPTVPNAGIRFSFNNLQKLVDIKKMSFIVRKLFN